MEYNETEKMEMKFLKDGKIETIIAKVGDKIRFTDYSNSYRRFSSCRGKSVVRKIKAIRFEYTEDDSYAIVNYGKWNGIPQEIEVDQESILEVL